MKRRRRTAPTPPPSPWVGREVWAAVIDAYAELRLKNEPELLRSMKVCEATIQQVQGAETAEAAEALTVNTLGTRSGPILVRAIRAGHPDIVRAKLVEDYHRTIWPEALRRAGQDLLGHPNLEDELDPAARDELEALCLKTLRRYASQSTWDVVVESAGHQVEQHQSPQFPEVLRRQG